MNRRDAYDPYSEQDQDGQWTSEEDDQAQDPYATPYEQQDEQDNDPSGYQPTEEPYYQQPVAPRRVREPAKPQVISTNTTINLTCTICAGCGLFGLFLYFADKRSRAVRRFAVQSAGLFCVTMFCLVGIAVIGTLLGFIPLIGGAMSALAWIAGIALVGFALFHRVQLMLHAYRGQAYIVPLIGRYCRQFE